MDKVMLQTCSQTSSGKKELKFVLRPLNRGEGNGLGTAPYAHVSTLPASPESRLV